MQTKKSFFLSISQIASMCSTLTAVVGCCENGDQLALRKKLIPILNDLYKSTRVNYHNVNAMIECVNEKSLKFDVRGHHTKGSTCNCVHRHREKDKGIFMQQQPHTTATSHTHTQAVDLMCAADKVEVVAIEKAFNNLCTKCE